MNPRSKQPHLLLWYGGPDFVPRVLVVVAMAGTGLRLLLTTLSILHVHVERHLQVLVARLQQVCRQAPLQACPTNTVRH